MKRSIVFFLVTTMVLVGCENSDLKDKSHAQTKTDPTKTSDHANDEGSNPDESNGTIESVTVKNENGQVFHVIPAYKWVDKFVQKALDTNSKSERAELWQRIVMDHVRSRCLTGAYSFLVEDYVYFPPKHLGKLQYTIELLKDSNIENSVVEALKASSRKFPGPETTVCLFPQGGSHFAGVTLDAGKISIFYLPYFSNHLQLLKSTVAHEYHHSAWKAKYAEEYNWNLLGSIIFEGRAEYFASLLYGPGAAKISDMKTKEESRLWNKIKDSLYTVDPEKMDTVLYGGKEGFPINFGYVVGYHIVRDYTESHPDSSIEDWSKLSPEKLYKKSGYGD
ncbi:MAG TPA: DUF2268 domain-containing putative Zn-dependent protease [Bacillales bacterium]|nr:DUF2268 domain-containing putative Zn-dependent protease [Bacillales bacterium]